jgi:5,5'-dehydrodivanillate O-demethylase
VLDNNSGQDIVAWITQGAITDRSHESLGRSDKGVVLYRRLLKEALDAVERGDDPMNVFRDTSLKRIDLAVEKNKLGRVGENIVAGMRSGNTIKYSPILKRMGGASR